MNGRWIARGGLGWLAILEDAVGEGVPFTLADLDALDTLQRRVAEAHAFLRARAAGSDHVYMGEPRRRDAARVFTFPPRGGRPPEGGDTKGE
jgi:hypothetical protein